MRIFVLFFAVLISNWTSVDAQEIKRDSVKTLSSIDVRADIAGLLMNKVGMGFTQYEAGVRVGLRNKYFPIFEIGYGTSDYTGETTGLISKSKAPFFRMGLDYNFTKPNRYDSRFTAGIRYGFSTYKYDLKDPNFGDDIWNEHRPLEVTGESGSAHWMELVAGAETRLWSIVHVGWNVRYKYRFSEKACNIGSPFYIPGYGQNKGIMWGMNFLLIFEI